MKRQLLITITLLLALTIQAQKGQPAFGKIDKADLEMTDCEFDKGADAMKLIDWGNMYYDRGTAGISFFKTIYERRVRIKILKEKGLSYADVKIPYYGRNDNEKVLKLEAYTYNLDAAGNVQATEVKKSSIYAKRIDLERFQMIITFPEVKVGSVIEYRYRMDRESIGLRDWVFQSVVPVRYSEYNIKVPKLLRFNVKPTIVDPIDTKSDVVSENISVDGGVLQTESVKTTYIMQKLPGIRDEPFMGSPADYMQRLEFQISQIDYGNGEVKDLRTKWSDVVENLLTREDFGKQLEEQVAGTETIVAQAKQIPDTIARIKFIYNAVRNLMSWNEDDDFTTNVGIAKAVAQKTGNTAEINLALIRVLRESGFIAMPILFSTRDNGLVNTYYPFANQFNTVMAYLNIGGKNLVLDATDRSSMYNLSPERVVNTNGFIVVQPNGRWIEYTDVKNKYKLMSAVKGVIDAEGIMKCEATVNCREYARRQRVNDWKKDKESFRKKYFTLTGVPVKIDELVVNNADADSLALEQRVTFATNLNSSGNYKYFNVNIFAEMDKNEFVKDERISDVDFGVLQDYTIFGNFLIPDGYTYDELPKDVSIVMPDNSVVFTRTMQAEENMLNVRIAIEYKSTFYPAGNYPEFKEFHKKMFSALNEQIVIKKK